MTKSDELRARLAELTAKAMAAAPGFDNADKLVECAICGIVTPRPKRVWKDGIHLCDMCEPCFRKRQER